MKIKSSKTGKILFEGRFKTMRRCVEAAVRDGVDLSGACLRYQNLRHANLDGACLKDAMLWGARLDYADLSGCQLSHADLRNTSLKETCLAESACRKCDFIGAFFQSTILEGSDLSGIRISCRSFFSLDLSGIKALKGAVYLHMGETSCPFSSPPVVIRRKDCDWVIMDTHVCAGPRLYTKKELEKETNGIFQIADYINKIQL